MHRGEVGLVWCMQEAIVQWFRYYEITKIIDRTKILKIHSKRQNNVDSKRCLSLTLVLISSVLQYDASTVLEYSSRVHTVEISDSLCRTVIQR